MKTIRIGNDIVIEWSIVRNGKAEDFRSKSLSLFVCHRYGREKVSSFSVDGNVLRFAFLGKNQRHVGDYGLLLIVNDGADGMFSVDLDRAFCLTQHTDCGCGGVVELMSDIGLPANGLSAYELAVINGFKGTEREWIDSLGKPAIDAAEQALSAASKADAAAESAIATNKAIQQHESVREQSEQERETSEQSRKQAEEHRASSELSRDKAEQARATAETSRTKAEQQRNTAESARVSAETGRVGAETSREQAETERKQAEQSRKQTEDARAKSEMARDKAERQRTSAETSRQAAEIKRQQDTATAIDKVKTDATLILNKVQTDSQSAIQDNNKATADAIDKASEATTAANDAALKADAAAAKAEEGADNIGIGDYPEFSAEKPYAVGDVVRFGGKLYRFKLIHSAGVWIGTDAEPTSVKSELSRAVALKANVDGYYETMRVGTADNLTPRGDVSEEIIMSRTAGGNNAIEAGTALIKSIKGYSLVRNQAVNIESLNGDDFFSVEHYKDSGVKCNPIGQPSEPGSQNWSSGWLVLSNSLLKDNVYYYSIKYTRLAKRTDKGEFTLQNVFLSAFEDKYDVEIGSPKVMCNIKKIVSNKCFLTLNDCIVTVENIQLVNLTQMFGTGNEPATAEEFAHRLGYDSIEQVPYIPYNEGNIVSCKVDGVRTTDAEGDTSERKWTSTLQKYFPNGLKSAGRVCDEITPTKAVKRVDAVKMKDLSWLLDNAEYKMFSARIADMKPANNANEQQDGIACNQYAISDKRNLGQLQQDISILRVGQYVYVKDSRYSDAETFVNHFSDDDVIFYELATPEEYTYDELNLSMRVAAGGTEEAIIPEGAMSTPLRMDVVYPIDAYGTIVKNKQSIGTLDKLTTTSKTDLVAAINELKGEIKELQQKQK